MFETFTLQMPMGSEWIWIAIIVGVFIFGAKKIPELAKTLGKAKGEYKKGEIESDKELKDYKEKADQSFFRNSLNNALRHSSILFLDK